MYTVKSHNCEFGYELIAALPYAYWHYLNGSLKATVSGTGSEPLYFFSPSHRIDSTQRDFAHTIEAAREIPNMRIHRAELDTTKWVPPPFAQHYKPNAITFTKPTVVVYNRYNYEWDKPPINYFDLPTLRALFNMLLPKYDIVYFNVRGEEALEDNAHSMDLGDYEMIRAEFPQVHIIHDLCRQYKQDYNTVQLRVFAGCRKFITMNGAPSILASYFGGENIIYTVWTREITANVGSFHGWYHKFNPSDPSHIRLVRRYDDLLDTVKMAWVEQLPLINVLVRCHNRPKGLSQLLKSIEKQGRHNVRVIVSYDNKETVRYLTSIPVTRIGVSSPEKTPRPEGDDYKGWLGPNEYLNVLMNMVTSGYIVFMDDDDLFYPGAFDMITAHANEQSVLLCRVSLRDGRVCPDNEHLGTITAGYISGIGICFHHSHRHKARWTPWRRGDYRFIRDLAAQVPPKYLDDVLCGEGPRPDSTRMTAEQKEERARRVAERAQRILAGWA